MSPLLRTMLPTLRAAPVARRFISSTPQHRATEVKEGISLGPHTTITPLTVPSTVLASAAKAAHWNEPGAAPALVDDYSTGPSALDKASRLFFFTEILRGQFRRSMPSCPCRRESAPSQLVKR